MKQSKENNLKEFKKLTSEELKETTCGLKRYQDADCTIYYNGTIYGFVGEWYA